MSNKIVDSIRRTGDATSPIRQIVVVQGKGKAKSETTLSTKIEKITWAPEYRTGASVTPMEQYAFKVGNKVIERFADATALVLKKHHVKLSAAAAVGAQTYVREAYKIMAGEKEMSILEEIPETAVPAIVERETV